MPRTPPEVFWRSGDGSECRLRSTDHGWCVERVDSDGVVLQNQRVTSTQEARQLAKNWNRQKETPDRGTKDRDRV